MKKLFAKLLFLFMAAANTPDLETGEIKVLSLLKDVIDQPRKKDFCCSRNLLSRDQIDTADIQFFSSNWIQDKMARLLHTPVKVLEKHG